MSWHGLYVWGNPDGNIMLVCEECDYEEELEVSKWVDGVVPVVALYEMEDQHNEAVK